MGSAGIDEAESIGCAQWLRSALCSSPSAAATPPLQVRRPTLYLKLVTPTASAPPPWLLPLNMIDKTEVCQHTPKDLLHLWPPTAPLLRQVPPMQSTIYKEKKKYIYIYI
ncbi:hypothetical protein EV1_029615 [Malus domestica]